MEIEFSIRKVKYNLFNHDLKWLDDNSDLPNQEIDGEIELINDEADSIYLSWKQIPAGYTIEIQDRSFFTPPSIYSLDVSKHKLWNKLINRKVDIFHADDQKFVLAIYSQRYQLFVCCYENSNWGSDTLYISRKIPAWH